MPSVARRAKDGPPPTKSTPLSKRDLPPSFRITQNAEPCSTSTSSVASPHRHKSTQASRKTSASASQSTTQANHPTPSNTPLGTSKPIWLSPTGSKLSPSNATSKPPREPHLRTNDFAILRLPNSAKNALHLVLRSFSEKESSQSKARPPSLQRSLTESTPAASSSPRASPGTH